MQKRRHREEDAAEVAGFFLERRKVFQLFEKLFPARDGIKGDTAVYSDGGHDRRAEFPAELGWQDCSALAVDLVVVASHQHL